MQGRETLKKSCASTDRTRVYVPILCEGGPPDAVIAYVLIRSRERKVVPAHQHEALRLHHATCQQYTLKQNTKRALPH